MSSLISPNPNLVKKKIGLLGGSFNPAHAAHLHFSKYAKIALDLDEVWWLVSPQNPLKSKVGMASFETRLLHALSISQAYPYIKICDYEEVKGLNQTYKTLKSLLSQFKNKCNFVFMIGSDNLIQFPKWKNWQGILKLLPIAVFPRHPHYLRARLGKIATRPTIKKYYSGKGLHSLPYQKPPALGFIDMKRHPLSATQLRENEPNFYKLFQKPITHL